MKQGWNRWTIINFFKRFAQSNLTAVDAVFLHKNEKAEAWRRYHGGEVRDAWQWRVDGEFEGHRRQKQNERQVETILWFLNMNGVCSECHAADKKLHIAQHKTRPASTGLLVSAAL